MKKEEKSIFLKKKKEGNNYSCVRMNVFVRVIEHRAIQSEIRNHLWVF